MKNLGMVIGLLFIIMGFSCCEAQSWMEGGTVKVHTPKEGDVPLCPMASIVPCMNMGITSYIRNTQGEEAARRPPDPASSQLVGMAFSTDLTNPGADVNSSCEVLQFVDLTEMTSCMTEATKDCSVAPTEDDQKGVLPSLRYFTFFDAAELTSLMCSKECLMFPLVKNMGDMIKCWKIADDSLNMAQNSNISASSETCSDVETYLLCQWNKSTGCPYLEKVTRLYVQRIKPVISKCNILLPSEALSDPLTVSKGASLGNLLVLKVVLTFVFGVFAESFLDRGRFLFI